MSVDEFGRIKATGGDEEREARLREKLRSRRQRDASLASGSNEQRERENGNSEHYDGNDQSRPQRDNNNNYHERDARHGIERDFDSRNHHHADADRENRSRHDDVRHDNRRQHHDNRSGNRDYEATILQPGNVYQGRVVRVETYGAFVQLHDVRNAVGLVHISQLRANERVERVEHVVQMNQLVHVKVLEIEGNSRIRLSMAGVDQETGEIDARQQEETRGGRAFNEARRDGRHGGGGGHSSLEQRAKQRQEEMRRLEVTWKDELPVQQIPYLRALWSASPKPPAAPGEASKATSKRQKAKSPTSSDSESTSSSSSSSEDSRRRSRSKRSRRDRSSRSRRSSKRSKRRRRSYSSSSSSSSTETSSSKSSSASQSSETSSERDRKKKFNDANATAIEHPLAASTDVHDFKDAVQATAREMDSSDEDDGPQPLPMSNAALNAASTGSSAPYGKALLPGEGQAIAQYVQQNLRVPRRGEIGVSQDAIEKYEQSGYVMSGSRHAKMNAVRLRKENQVYSAEEQRALALITMEENQQKEAAMMEEFRRKLKEKQAAREAK